MVEFEELWRLLLSRGFVIPNSEAYGGLAGFYDYGPAGTLLRQKLIRLFRQRCVREEGFVEIDGSLALREEALRASGHLTGFWDPIATCKKCGAPHKLDQLAEEQLKTKVSGMSVKELNEFLTKHKVKCPNCGTELKDVAEFHLMYKLDVGKDATAYLRPETAQNIFVDFPRIARATRDRLPLGVAQIGRSFRNEISPRQGLMRMREFTQMELEVFLEEKDLDNHPRWGEVKGTEIVLVDRTGKEHKETVEKLWKEKLIINQYLAYWLAKQALLYRDLGVNNFRFVHLSEKETPFYSKANYDMEVQTSLGWKEMIGTAYRTNHDLSSHGKASGKDFSVTEAKIIPHVIEPSFGLDRMFYAVIEAAYVPKGEREWSWLRLPPVIAPVTAMVLPLMKKDGLAEKASGICHSLLKEGFDVQYDETGSIGKRYARADEIGVPMCITIDYETLKSGVVTLRNRDTTKQVPVKSAELGIALRKLLKGDLEF